MGGTQNVQSVGEGQACTGAAEPEPSSVTVGPWENPSSSLSPRRIEGRVLAILPGLGIEGVRWCTRLPAT